MIDKKEKWIDPDDAPPLTQDWFDKAELREGDKVIRPATSLRGNTACVVHYDDSGSYDEDLTSNGVTPE